MGATGFDDLVTQSTGTRLVGRPRLTAAVERSVASCRLTLLTGEPGTGRTTLLAALARDHPDWLRYFVHRDDPTSLASADPAGFLIATGHQLARTRPALFDPDGSSPFDRTAHAGIAVDRAYLDPRLEPTTLLDLALRTPAARLAAAEPASRIVILVDATAGGALADWLIQIPDLPGNVRLVLAARPLPRPRTARKDLTQVVIQAGTREACDEVTGYALSTLPTTPDISAGLARQVAEKARGNFLYVSAHAHALASTSDPRLLLELRTPESLPLGLPALYALLLDAVLTRAAGVDGVARGEAGKGKAGREEGARAEAGTEETARARAGTEETARAEAGTKEAGTEEAARAEAARAEAGTEEAARAEARWEQIVRAVLGLLAVAFAPLSAADLVRLSGLPVGIETVRAVLRWLQPLLRERDGRFALFHESIGEYLTAPETRAARPGRGVDPVEWHRRLVRSCLGDGMDPATVDWPAAGDYELVHLADHLIAAGETERLPDLVCPGLRRAVRARYGHDRWFIRVVDLALEAALTQAQGERGPTGERRPTGERGPAGTQAAAPAKATSAEELATLLFLSVVKGELARAAGVHHPPAVLGLACRLGRADEAWENAWAMPPSARRIAALAEVVRYAGGEDRVELLVEQATEAGAFREAAVALARYDLPRALELWHRTGTDAPPDPVYRAVGDPALFARMAAGRTAACLDAAAGSSPADRTVLLLHAQSGLELLGARDRVVALARLADLDRAGAARYLPALRREAVLLDAENNRLDARALAEAAALLAGVDANLAANWLQRCARVVPERARALTSLGRRDEARLLLTVRLAESPGPEERLRLAQALEPIDPQLAAETVDELTATPRSPALLAALVRFLAHRDPDRAAALARRASGDHRDTLLAGLAHRHLDEGRTDRAEALLGELYLRSAQRTPLRDPEAAPQPADDVRRRWTHLYTDPAQVVRAMAPGPSAAGNPYSLARALRVFTAGLAEGRGLAAEPATLAEARGLAAELATLIEDRGEAAIAQAALIAAAIRDRDLDGEACAWRRLRHLVVRMPSGGTALDRTHLARFETAIAVLPFQPDLGSALLSDLPAFGMVFQLAFGCDASTRYTEQRLAGRRPDPAAAQVHESLRRQPPGALPDPVLGAVVTATVSANEQMLGGAELTVDDPVYRLYAKATARTRRARLPGAEAGKAVEARPLDMGRLPAYAEIVRRNAGSPVVAGLAAQVGEAAEGRNEEAQLILAEAGYGDPRSLIATVAPADHLLPELSVLLFRHDPARALKVLSDAAVRRWTVAAAILEFAAAELLTAAGPRVGNAVHAAVVRAVNCCTPADEDRPEVIDGTWTGRPR